MNTRFCTIEADGVRLTLDLAVGHIRHFEINRAGRLILPLHVAPWVDDSAISADQAILPNLKYLAGDFFCAPFGRSDVEEAPSHGWPANSQWQPIDQTKFEGGVSARFQLIKRVMGATLVKEITLRDNHPFAYQRHVFAGGQGAVSVASHAMTRFDRPGFLFFSPKAFAETPPLQQEPDPRRGHSVFAKNARCTDLTKLPLADGSTADLHRYPIGEAHEDFVMLVEARDSPLGWTAAVRLDEGDIVLSLKNPADFPMTFLWYSNGGRYYAPWNGRHRGVLGIEEARAYSAHGHAASIAANPLSDEGFPTALALDPNGEVEVRHVLGGLSLAGGAKVISSVTMEGAGLVVTCDTGEPITIPFDRGFLRLD
jgi:hypothetical protein